MEREDEAAIAQVEADIEACEALLRGAAPPQRASGALQLLAGAGGARREAEEAAIKAAGAEAAGDGAPNELLVGGVQGSLLTEAELRVQARLREGSDGPVADVGVADNAAGLDAASLLGTPHPQRREQQQQQQEDAGGLSGAVAAWAQLAADQGAAVVKGSLVAAEEMSVDRSVPQEALVQEILRGLPPHAASELAGVEDVSLQAGVPLARLPPVTPMQMDAMLRDVEGAGGAQRLARSKSPGRAAARSKSPGRRSVAMEMLERDEAELTFQPNASRGKPPPHILPARLDVLAVPRRGDEAARTRAAEEAAAREMAECTFEPNAPRGRRQFIDSENAANDDLGEEFGSYAEQHAAERRSRSRSRSRSAEPPWERLHRAGKGLHERSTNLQESTVAREMTECTFTPAISAVSEHIADELRTGGVRTGPLHERLAEVQRERAEERARVREAALMAETETLTFAPALNDVSRRIVDELSAEGARVSPGEHNPLVAEGSARSVGSQRGRAVLEAQAAAEAELTFRPEVNSVSEALVAARLPPTFEERQAAFARRRATRKMLSECSEGEGCTFTPELCRAEEVLCRSARDERRRQLYESGDAKVERLSRHDLHDREAARAAVRAEVMADYTFEPRLCRKSREMVARMEAECSGSNVGGGGPRTGRGAASAAAVAAARRASEARACTFKPVLEGGERAERRRRAAAARRPDSATAAIRRPEDHARRVKEAQEQREAKLAECRRMLEQAELKECTFTPKLVARPHSAVAGGLPATADSAEVAVRRRPVVVRGLRRHLELKELSSRLKEDQAARERKAFSQPAAAGASLPARRGATTPRPFRLTGRPSSAKGLAARRRAQAKADAHNAEMGECTFRPKTRAAERTALVQRLLDKETLAYV